MAKLFDTPPLVIVDRPAAGTHYTKGRGGALPRYIVMHHTGGTNSLEWLTRTSPNRVSAHRLIAKDGTIYKLVDDSDVSNAAGFAVVGPVDPDTNDPAGVPPNFNYDSLNIELENLGTGRDPYPMAQMVSAARQVLEWWGKFGYLAVVGHGWVDARKNDPLGFDWPLLYRLIDIERLRLVQPLALPAEFVGHLRSAAQKSQDIVAELTAMVASVTP
jgi:N-acetyl-anhydromuramyl-L-alanine amidase AmpD